jgi:hypothetical protein
MSARVDDVTDVFVALITAKRGGMTPRELDDLLRACVEDLADRPEDVSALLSKLVGLMLQHTAIAFGQLDLLWQQPWTDRWIAVMVEVAAEARADQ